jgi:hypothetical protein
LWGVVTAEAIEIAPALGAAEGAPTELPGGGGLPPGVGAPPVLAPAWAARTLSSPSASSVSSASVAMPIAVADPGRKPRLSLKCLPSFVSLRS